MHAGRTDGDMAASPDKLFKKCASNKKALHDYFVLERYEAGIQLYGTEVKSVKEGHISLTGGYARVENGNILIYHLNIRAYEYGNKFNHDPDRTRQLLLHRHEIKKIQVQIEQKGNTLVPLSAYIKRGKVKIELGLCKGKGRADKREVLRQRTAEREAERATRRSVDR